MISFKKVKRKFKVSRDKLASRTKRTWLNSWSAMLVYKLIHGDERRKQNIQPYPYMSCGDQKGIMLNEAESTNANSMEFAGCDDVGVKTNHGQSRQRASIWTSMSDVPDPSESDPWEICFKLRTDLKLKDLVIPAGLNITLAHSPSGSYNYPTTMQYLQRHVKEWSAEREKTLDFRLIFLDDYSVHKMVEVKKLCWDRGHLKIQIGGGCTFILCCNDLDCHADIEAEYIEMDVEWAAEELKQRPWVVPKKTRQGFVDDIACIYDKFPAKRRGPESFKRSGLGARPPDRVFKADGSWEVPLAGPDDWRINRDAKAWFLHSNMPRERQTLLTQIYKDFDNKLITSWEDVLKYQKDFSDSEDGGEHGEGEELFSEHPLSSGSDTDLSEEEKVVDALVEHQSCDAIVSEVAGADSSAMKELKLFDELILKAKRDIQNPRVAHTLERNRKELERKLRGIDTDVLKDMESERVQSLDELAQKRKQLREQENEMNSAKKQENDKKKEARKKKDAEKAEKEKNKLLALEIDKGWDRVDFGSVHKGADLKKSKLEKKHRDNIREFLTRTLCYAS